MKKTGEKIKRFIGKETVLCIAVLLAAVSTFFVRPDRQYLEYIDFKVLVILFCLMAVLCGFQELGVFRSLAVTLLGRVKTYRQLLTVQILVCFFSAMLITNDVALITFVPFAILTLQMIKMPEKIPVTVVLQTIAANLGSMFTPIGNPQNLYIYEKSGMHIGEFFREMFPVTAVSFILLLVFCLFSSGKQIVLELPDRKKETVTGKDKVCFFAFSALFVFSILTVLRVIHYGVLLALTLVTVTVLRREILKKVDYGLLITFIGFFIFIGNLGRIPVIREGLERMIAGRELPVAFLSSQILSNVPATVLLTEFTTAWQPLLWGVNIGGLGTVIASMASVISFKLYGELREAKKGKYLILFTGYSLIFAAVLFITAYRYRL